jgi:hypothetical protein
MPGLRALQLSASMSSRKSYDVKCNLLRPRLIFSRATESSIRTCKLDVPTALYPFHNHDPVALLAAFVIPIHPWYVDLVSQLWCLGQQFGTFPRIGRFVRKGRFQAHLIRHVGRARSLAARI